MLTQEQLSALELQGRPLGLISRLDLPQDEIGHGAGFVEKAVTAAMIAAGQVNATFVPVPVPAAERMQVEISVYRPQHGNPFILAQFPSGVEPGILRRPGTPDEAIARDEGDAAAVVLEVRPGVAAELQVGGQGSLVIGEGHIVDVRPMVPPVAQVEFPVEQWCADCSDEWLASEVIQIYGADDHPWNRAVAAGMYARLREPAGPEEVRRTVSALLEGRSDGLLAEAARPRAWARALSPDQRETITSFAAAAADQLHLQLEDLDAENAAEDEQWLDELLGACEARDELEGVLLLLDEAGTSDQLREVIGWIDTLGAELVHRTPEIRGSIVDEQLRRASIANPDAWWTIPVQVPDALPEG